MIYWRRGNATKTAGLFLSSYDLSGSGNFSVSAVRIPNENLILNGTIGTKTTGTPYIYLQALERVNGIEPSFRSRKAVTHKTLYYQHILTLLT
jgi:hypothetical protein